MHSMNLVYREVHHDSANRRRVYLAGASVASRLATELLRLCCVPFVLRRGSKRLVLDQVTLAPPIGV